MCDHLRRIDWPCVLDNKNLENKEYKPNPNGLKLRNYLFYDVFGKNFKKPDPNPAGRFPLKNLFAVI